MKQSCEQKKLSLPILRQFGHCRAPASFSHSTPMHFFISGGLGPPGRLVVSVDAATSVMRSDCRRRCRGVEVAVMKDVGGMRGAEGYENPTIAFTVVSSLGSISGL